MLHRSSHLLLVAATTLIASCADNAPTSPRLTSPPEESVASARRPSARLTAAFDQTVAGTELEGAVRVTRFGQSPTGQLLVSGIISGTADGQAFTQAFSDIPATLASATAASVSGVATGSMAAAVGTCDILLLDLGPLSSRYPWARSRSLPSHPRYRCTGGRGQPAWQPAVRRRAPARWTRDSRGGTEHS